MCKSGTQVHKTFLASVRGAERRQPVPKQLIIFEHSWG